MMTPTVRVRRRHRRTVAWVLSLFLLSQILLGAAIDQAWPTVRDPEYAVKKRRLDALVAENPDRPLTLILGSSRAGHGFRAKDLTDETRLTFNFSIPASGPLMLAQTWNRLDEERVRYDRVILEVLPIFLNAATGIHQEDRMLDSARLSYREYREIRASLYRRGSADRRWLFARLLPIRRHRVELRDALSPDVWSEFDEPISPLRWMDEHGWQSRPVPPEERPPLLALAHRQYDSFYPAFVEDTRQTYCLKHAVWELASVFREVKLVTMPEATEFRDLLTAGSKRAQNECVRKMAEELKCEWVDARDWIADDGFYDGHHLLAEGATTMTRLWRERVNWRR